MTDTLEDEPFEFLAGEPPITEPLELSDAERTVLLTSVRRLPLIKRAMVKGRFILGLDQTEIARTYGARPEEVRSDLAHGLKRLRQEIEVIAPQILQR
jgi:DNA-directed RNA polymerase specialized sigma24 family protein